MDNGDGGLHDEGGEFKDDGDKEDGGGDRRDDGGGGEPKTVAPEWT